MSLNSDKNQFKKPNKMSIVNYEDDDYKDISLKKRSKSRSDYYSTSRSSIHKNERDDHSHRQPIRSNNDDYEDSHRSSSSSSSHNHRSHHYDHDSRNHHRSSSSRTSRNRFRKKSESPERFHHGKKKESRHKHGGNCRKSKRDRSHHHHHHQGERAKESSKMNYGRMERQHHNDCLSRSRSPDSVKHKESSLVSKLPKLSEPDDSNNVMINKAEVNKPIVNSVEITNQVEKSNETKKRELPEAVLASVAAVVANIKAQQQQQTTESVSNPSKTTEIPKYYNAKMVNAAKIAQLAEKRKLLWSDNKNSSNDKAKTSSSTSTNVWTNLKFQGEHGQAMTEKFRKLMGIKTTDDTSQRSSSSSSINDDADKNNRHNENIASNQAKLFENLDQQYSIARRSTHLARGVGLGFSNTGMTTSFQRSCLNNDE